MSGLASAWEALGGSLREVNGEQNTVCVLHEDTTPSARVNLDKGLFFCPVCGIGGDIHTLIMKAENVDFRGAKRIAQEQYGEEGSAAKPGKRPGRKGGSWRPSWL